MVRVYSQPGHGGDSSLGGIFGSSYQPPPGLDYGDILDQKRREEKKYRSGIAPYTPVHKSASDGFLNQVAGPPPPEYTDTGLQGELDNLSTVLTRLQGSVVPDGDLSTDYSYSKSYPTSASLTDSLGRKTWSAPNKDPAAGGSDIQREMDRQFGKTGELEDPLQRYKSHSGQSHGSSYQPSFGAGGANTRARRGGGNAAPPVSDRGQYLQELEEQMREQRRRKEKEDEEAGTDWWEKKKTAENEYKMPQPSQGQNYADRGNLRKGVKASHRISDPAEARKRYEQELKEQVEAKKRVDDEIKRKEQEEEEKLERRLKDQQEKMKREYDEEVNKKKAKEEAKRKREEQLMQRQLEMQKEMEKKKREANEKRHSEKRSARRPRSRKPSAEPSEQPQGINFRSDSPPIPTMRSNQVGGEDNQPTDRVDEQQDLGGTQLLEQLQTSPEGPESRKGSLKGEDDFGAGGWDGLAEL